MVTVNIQLQIKRIAIAWKRGLLCIKTRTQFVLKRKAKPNPNTSKLNIIDKSVSKDTSTEYSGYLTEHLPQLNASNHDEILNRETEKYIVIE